MGYHVAIMADSTSRWAEALREISGRLEEMPAEEGFPAYLPSRISQFYERAGMIRTLGGKDASISIIGLFLRRGLIFPSRLPKIQSGSYAVSGALDKSLAYTWHYPAIN